VARKDSNDPESPRPSRTAAGGAYAKLREAILSGTLSPAERLRVNDVAERYQYGAIPTREALNRLAAEHLVIYSEQRGFAVAPISRDDLTDLAKARSMMVEVAMREAIQKGDVAWEERVLVAYHRLSKVPRYLDLEARTPNPNYDFSHRLFHTALISGCGSKWMVQLCERLFDHAERYRNLSRKLTVAPREDEHKKIVAAALGRRLDETIALSKRHVEITAEIILGAPDDSSPKVMD
jgi:GntR family transcriptional regulator, carbon starvation induced regulator